MDPCYIDIDCFWPNGADSKGPEGVSIAIYYYGSPEMWRELGPKCNSSLETASVML